MTQRDISKRPDPPEVRIDADGIPLPPGLSPSRRAFLRLAGFSFASAMLGGCGRGTAHDAIPLLDRPEEVTPGTAAYYAGLCGGCRAGCGILAKVRDGRPIKIEGNDLDPIARGRTCAVGQAQVLSLYDAQRLRQPLLEGKPSTWKAIDATLRARLAAVQQSGKQIRVLTDTRNGPTDRAAVQEFLQAFPGAKHVMYDALSASALREAHEKYYGKPTTPRYRIENAHVLVSVDADFLGTWLSPVEYTRGWSAARSLAEDSTSFLHHVQFESRVSLTGSNADRRVPVLPQDFLPVLAALAERVAVKLGKPRPWQSEFKPALSGADEILDDVAKRLLAAKRGRALVLCGVNDLQTQLVACHLNALLGAADTSIADRTIELQRSSQQRLGDDRGLDGLLSDLHGGKVGGLLVGGCNPLYDLPGGANLTKALEQLDLVVSFAERLDETAERAHFVCPDHHPLESWRDAEPWRGTFTLSQPAINPLGDTRAFAASLSSWSGGGDVEQRLVRDAWRTRVFPRTRGERIFEAFWQQCVHDGSVEVDPGPGDGMTANPAAVAGIHTVETTAPPGGPVLVLYPKIGLLDGRHAHNPWLQELPDPISKVSWDNYACFAPADAAGRGIADGDLVQVAVGGAEGTTVTLPSVIQRGQAEGAVALALGYGRKGTDRFARVGPQWLEGDPTVRAGETVGVNVATLLAWGDGHIAYTGGAGVAIRRLGRNVRLARTQIYDSLDVPKHLAPDGKTRRKVAPLTTKAAYDKDRHAGSFHEHAFEELWGDDHPFSQRHWGLAIDLSACTGCAACVVACQAENNIPVVGKDEVRRQREMHWLRIDRYFQGEGADLQTVHQPMMCQQCDHAPCETVCPVLATVHSSEGLNQQVYNRCVGTRYCSNNCPYKVRRFNWFDYPREDRLQNMVLNPDVTVRSRGVMEKCTFCVQRIQEAKAVAKRDGRPMADGDIRTACQQACPADAIVFGDMNDPGSRLITQMKSPRANRVLGELGIRPSVAYLTQVQDREEKGERHD